MNGPEHYREAERLIDTASGEQPSADHAKVILAAAQAHATLALAAAVAGPVASQYDGDENYARSRGWAGLV